MLNWFAADLAKKTKVYVLGRFSSFCFSKKLQKLPSNGVCYPEAKT
jgi:hypothetical protein